MHTDQARLVEMSLRGETSRDVYVKRRAAQPSGLLEVEQIVSRVRQRLYMTDSIAGSDLDRALVILRSMPVGVMH